MSINATFVQVDAVELARIQRDPSLAEGLFQAGVATPDVFTKLSEAMRKSVAGATPEMLAQRLALLDPRIKERLYERLGKRPGEATGPIAAEDLLNLMDQTASQLSSAQKSTPKSHPSFSLDKEWHGVHYLLCGEAEAGATLLSQAVLGGAVLGDDDEGFSGYGPARYFTPAQVAELAKALNRPELQTEAAARFDPVRMTELQIYPRWRPGDEKELLEAVRRLSGFYAAAAAKGHAIVSCLV